ncbi:MAG: Hsp20/alpha crystallin family protein, partial [Flavobacteriaceae bacterium]|nr:Hsp20/alpha crystallin family protein [Flavobacteriaceae bacterium]
EYFPIKNQERTTYVPSKFAVDIKDEAATLALSVIGHDPKDIEINCFEDKIEIKAKKTQEDKENPFNQLISDIEERVTVGKNFDGRKAKAEIKNGILLITIERKEESKPKKLTPKVG